MHAESLRTAERRTLEMIADGASLQDVLTHLCDSIDVQVSPSVTSVLLMERDGKHLVLTAGPKVPPEWVCSLGPVPVAPDAGLCGTAASLKTRVIVTDVATEPNWHDEYRDLAIRNGIRAAWSEPILTKDNQVLGTFAVYSSEPRVPTDADLVLIEAAGRLAFVAIERKRSREALRSALDTIRKSEEELRRMIDAVAQTIIVLNPDGRAIFANRVALEYTGLSLDDVRADDFRERVFHPDDIQRVRETREKGLSGTVPFENEQRALGKDGKYRWFLIRYNPLLDERGSVLRWYATGTDIQDRKQTETLYAAEKRTLEMIADGASLKDVLNYLCASIDVQVAPSVTTVFLMDADGKHLVLTGGPRVPGQWISAVSPRPVTHNCGLCGKAAFSKRRVIVADVATDPGRPDEYRELALSNG